MLIFRGQIRLFDENLIN